MFDSNVFFLSYVVLWILVLVQFASVFLLYRHFGRELIKHEAAEERRGPKVGEAVTLRVKTVDGEDYLLGSGSGRPHVVVFGNPRCSHCERVQPILAELTEMHRTVPVVVVYGADKEVARKYASAVSSTAIAVADPRQELSRLWDIRSTPYAISLDSLGTVKDKGVAIRKRRIESFFGLAAANPTEAA